jgi:Spy/CpxP family protein refolding chaperone
MKRTIWAGAFAALIAVAISAPLVAQPPQGPGGRGPGRGGFGGPMGPGGPGMGFPMLRELNLTDAQREQVRALTQQRRDTQANDPRRKAADLERQLQLAIFADAPDQQKAEELKNAIAAAHAEELAARIDLETRIAQILTPEQRAQARERLDKGGPPRGRGR